MKLLILVLAVLFVLACIIVYAKYEHTQKELENAKTTIAILKAGQSDITMQVEYFDTFKDEAKAEMYDFEIKPSSSHHFSFDPNIKIVRILVNRQ